MIKHSKFIILVLTICIISTCSFTLAEPKTYIVNKTSIMFDADYYAKTNPDVVNQLGSSEKTMLNHYIHYGINEGRKPYAGVVVSDVKDASVSAASKAGMSALNDLYVKDINNLRISLGLKPLILDKDLCNIASVRVKELPQKWSHTRPDGTPWYTAFDAVSKKYQECAIEENLAFGTRAKDSSAQDMEQRLFDALCKSKGHYKNMIAEDMVYLGIASYTKDDKVYTAFTFSSDN